MTRSKLVGSFALAHRSGHRWWQTVQKESIVCGCPWFRWHLAFRARKAFRLWKPDTRPLLFMVWIRKRWHTWTCNGSCCSAGTSRSYQNTLYRTGEPVYFATPAGKQDLEGIFAWTKCIQAKCVITNLVFELLLFFIRLICNWLLYKYKCRQVMWDTKVQEVGKNWLY